MAPQMEVKGKPLPVDTISLERHGRAEITLRAPVTDTESFYFTVPKTTMQAALDSLEVHDTRGERPLVSFPSPIVTRVRPLVIEKTSAWKDLLTQHQGAHVELHTRSGPVEGHFLGFQKPDRYNPKQASVVLLCDGNVCVHEADSISAIAFKGVQVGEKLERYTSTLCRIQEESSVYRIDVTASGIGAGEVVVSYTALSPHHTTFDCSYTIHADEDTDANDTDCNKTADGGRPGYPRVRVRCYAVIRNPLHYDVSDAHFILHTGQDRYYSVVDTYNINDEPEEDVSQSSSSSSSGGRRRIRNRSPTRTRSPSPPVRSPVPSSPPKSASLSDTESDSISETRSFTSFSSTSLKACRHDRSRKWDVPDRICLKEGESAKVLLYETEMEGGIVHRIDVGDSCRRAVLLHNTTDKTFEPGKAIFFAPGISVKLSLGCMKPEQDQSSVYGASGCAVQATNTSRRGEVLCSRIVDKKLVAKVIWYHKRRYLVHNKEDEHINMILDHKHRRRTGREVQMTATFYHEASMLGDEEDEDGGEELDQYSKGYLNWTPYLICVAPKRRCAIVVSETEEKLETYMILDCSKQEIMRLEQRKVVGPGLAEKLRQLVEMGRDLKKKKKTKKLFGKRLDGMKKYSQELAEAKMTSEAEVGKDKLEEFFNAVEATGDSITRIEKEVDKLETDEVKLKGQIKGLKEEICDMKLVELGSEVKEGEVSV